MDYSVTNRQSGYGGQLPESRLAAITAASLMRCTAALLFWAFLIALTHTVKKHYKKRNTAKQFQRFSKEHGCGRTKVEIPYSFVPNVFGKRFETYGATHALYDGYGISRVVHSIEPRNSRSGHDRGGFMVAEPENNQGRFPGRFTESVEEVIEALFDNITAATDVDGWTETFTMFHAFAQMSLDRSTKHMFGVSTGLQASSATRDDSPSDKPKQHVSWKEAFDTIASFVGVRSLLGTKAWVYDAPRFCSACGLLRKLCDDVIQCAIGEKSKGAPITASFVGHNMTAGALPWLFLELERHPEVYSDVRQEVLDAFGTQKDPKEEMTWETAKMQETAQCHLRSLAGTTLPTGGGPDGCDPVAVAKGTVVMCCLFFMHRRNEESGAEPDKFRPERWEGRYPGPEYAPFGGGPRVCPGQLFGLVEMFYTTARIMQRFRGIRLPSGAAQVRRLGAGVLLPPGGAEVQLQVAG
ncbi:hypothetical protein QQS21_011406 [Conoideocrella luteorostrata]|uniref:Cytochrome P450 n=1 Tax=Conoideocrella luteorostrata TaxID=1105319 RepID=A0AAJ0FTR8_9HYPO|nr:hypothetical protein QQS21_011406 [Conoideocrella luteorostrata]